MMVFLAKSQQYWWLISHCYQKQRIFLIFPFAFTSLFPLLELFCLVWGGGELLAMQIQAESLWTLSLPSCEYELCRGHSLCDYAPVGEMATGLTNDRAEGRGKEKKSFSGRTGSILLAALLGREGWSTTLKPQIRFLHCKPLQLWLLLGSWQKEVSSWREGRRAVCVCVFV